MEVAFGPYRLRRQERMVLGPAGPIELSARSFDILTALLARPNELIDKSALFEAVWPGVAVEENTLQVHVSALRKALDPSFIVTVHGRGYKYAGPAPAASGGESGAAKLDTKPVIVVLPFENLSGDPAQQYFSDGITGDITDRLTRFRNFAVIGTHSASAFRGPVTDFTTIRKRLRADFVVTGSARRAGDRIRISVRLSNAASKEAIWAHHYDRPMADLFSLQDEISELVASAIARHLEIEINVRSSAQPTAALSSYEHLLQGYWHFKKLTRAASLAARASFESAVALDPRNAEALSWLGVTYCEEWVQDFVAARATQGEALAAQAVALDPANAKCHAIHAWALLCIGELDRALRAGDLATSLNPGDPAVLINGALALAYAGKQAEARALIDQAHRLEPVPPLWFGEFKGVAAFAAGDYEQTLAGVEGIPECAWDVMYALACYGLRGEADKARALLARFRESYGEPDWALGLSREPYRDPRVRENLVRGFEMALTF